jgi:acetolactate synthase-1/2/3 large subunit
MTGIANAHTARASVLILSGLPPQPQENRGALQDVVHTAFVAPLTRYARTVRDPAHVLPEMYEAIARAYGEGGGEPGPVYLDFPVDTLRAEVPQAVEFRRAGADRRTAGRGPRAGCGRCDLVCETAARH